MVQLAESIVRVKATRNQNLEEPITDPVYFKVNQLKKKQENLEPPLEYLLSFDKSLHLDDLWVTSKQLEQFNILRVEMANKQVKPRVSDDNILQETHNNSQQPEQQIGLDDEDEEIEYLARSERLRGFNMDQLDFCHHCMQLKQT